MGSKSGDLVPDNSQPNIKKDSNKASWDAQPWFVSSVSEYMLKMKKKGLEGIMDDISNFQVPPDYEFQFNVARLTFKYQLVYCPRREEVVYLNEPEEDLIKFKELWASKLDVDASNL